MPGLSHWRRRTGAQGWRTVPRVAGISGDTSGGNRYRAGRSNTGGSRRTNDPRRPLPASLREIFHGRQDSYPITVPAHLEGRAVHVLAVRLVGPLPTRGNYPRSFGFVPTGRFLYCCNQRADNSTVFKVYSESGKLAFTGHFCPVGNPSIVAFVDLAKGG